MSTSDDAIDVMLRDSAVSLLRATHDASRIAVVRGSEPGFDPEMWTRMANAGWMGLRVAADAGGADLGLRQAVVLADVFGALLVPEPYAEACLAPVVFLSALPASPAVARLNRLVATGETPVAVAWQEQIGQTGVEPTACRLTKTSAGFTLAGSKRFVCGAAGRLIVVARWDGELAVVEVPSEAGGLSRRGARLALGGELHDLSFADVALPDRALLAHGGVVEGALQRMLDEVLIFVAAQLAAVGRGALRTTIAYLRQRSQFGENLSRFQSIRHRVVDVHLQLRLAEASWRRALRRAELDAPDASAAASAAKARAADAAMLSARSAIQLHGAMGFAEATGIGQYYRAASRLAAFFGSADAHRRRFQSTWTHAELAS